MMMSRAAASTILWLPGWSMEGAVFDRLHAELPEFAHVTVSLGTASSPQELLALAEEGIASSGGLRPLVLCGWSLGGQLALQLAVKHRPAAVLLFATNARFTRPKEESSRGWPDAYLRQMTAGLKKDSLQTELAFRRMVGTGQEGEKPFTERLSPAGRWSKEALLAGLGFLRESDVLAELEKIDCPVLIVHGTHDRICPYEAGEELLSKLPQGRLITVPGEGHAPFLGRERELAERFRRWWHEQQARSDTQTI